MSDIDSTVEETQEDKEVSMEDTIRDTYRSLTSDKPEESTDETVEPSDGEPKETASRDESGRFAKKTEEAQEAEPAQPTEQEKPDVTLSPEFQRLGLRKDEAEAISANPIALQAFMRRSEEMHKGLEQYREKAQFGESVQRAIAPYAQNIQASGVTPDIAVASLFQADHMLRNGTQEQKSAMFIKLARDYGVDMNMAGQMQNTVNPEVYALQSQLQQMQGWIRQQSEARDRQEGESLNREIQRFASDPKNVHFEMVRNEMAGLLQSGIASNLEDAYERAIYANPSVRARVLAEQQAKADAARKADAAQKAEAAKKAAAVNVSRRGTLPSAKPIGTMEDTIREKARELGMLS